jgi:hypothetical protein
MKKAPAGPFSLFNYQIIELVFREPADHRSVASLCLQNIYAACERANVKGCIQGIAI